MSITLFALCEVVESVSSELTRQQKRQEEKDNRINQIWIPKEGKLYRNPSP